jgi:cytochrome c oxidase assembly factor CtaG
VDPYSWSVDADAVAVVPTLVVGYALLQVWWPASRERRFAFAASQLLLIAVFVTPLETLALHYLLSAHLLQNVVVAEWAPGLAVVGLSPALARELGRHPAFRAVTHPLVALPLWIGTYFVWHVPLIYDAALERPATLLHLEHATYFVAGALMWWPIVHGRWADGVKALYVFAAFVFASPLGLLLALLPRPVYPFYERAPHLWVDHLQDQQIAGLTMAAEQAVVFFAVFAFYLARFLRSEAIAGVYRSPP